MKFVGDQRYAPALARFETLVSPIQALAAMVLEIEVHPSFNTIPEAATHAQRTSAAGYLPQIDRLVINDEVFGALAEGMQVAVLGHEVGHAYRRRARLATCGPEDCYEADVLAIEWGVGTELIAERECHYGTAYAAILRGVQDGTSRDQLLASYRRWQILRNAGIV